MAARQRSQGRLPRPGLPEGSHLVAEIEHVVVLMMENHSYDNYLGWMEEHGDGFEHDADGNPVPSTPNLDAAGVPAPPRHRPTTTQQAGVPTQSWAACHIQLGDGNNDGFVSLLASWHHALPITSFFPAGRTR